MTTPEDDEVEASRAPLIDHLIELRTRLIRALIAFVVMFIVCFAGAKYIYNILVQPYVWAVGDPSKAHMVYTHALEFFFTQLQVAMFGAGFLAFPVIANQIYKFVAPGLYKNERQAFLPFLIATPILFLLGALVVYFMAMPLLMRFSVSMQQFGTGEGNPEIQFLPKVNEYLSLIMTLIFAFGICFQLPVILTLLGTRRDHRFAVPGRQAPLRHRHRLRDRGGADAAGRDLPARARDPDARPLRGLDLVGAHGRAKARPGAGGKRRGGVGAGCQPPPGLR